MKLTNLIFDVLPTPVGTTGGIFASVAFLIILIIVAFIAFKMLKRTVAMAVRMILVALILLIAIVGSVSLFLFTRHEPNKPSPAWKTPVR